MVTYITRSKEYAKNNTIMIIKGIQYKDRL